VPDDAPVHAAGCAADIQSGTYGTLNSGYLFVGLQRYYSRALASGAVKG
jgi:hypothetical protein